MMAKFALLKQWKYFPNFEDAEEAGQPQSGPNLVYLHYSYLNFTISVLFILFAVFDWWFFVFHPFLMGIVIDLEEKR